MILVNDCGYWLLSNQSDIVSLMCSHYRVDLKGMTHENELKVLGVIKRNWFATCYSNTLIHFHIEFNLLIGQLLK